MLTLLSTIISFLAGGLPKLLDFFQDSKDKSHELKIMSQQAERDMLMAERGFVAQARIEEIKNDGRISPEEFLCIDRLLNSLIDGIGGCERIKSTPIPFSYSMFIKKFIFLYVVSLPLAFVNIFGYWSAFISSFVFYALVSMEILAEEIEDPFGDDENDLATDTISERIKANCGEIFGNP